jgi:hypothetical protein
VEYREKERDLQEERERAVKRTFSVVLYAFDG